MGKNIFLICPVKNQNSVEGLILNAYISYMKGLGHKIHYPPRDTNQTDNIGTRICTDNMKAIKKADEVHIYWTGTSRGSNFDFGMSFMKNKKIYLVNYHGVKEIINEYESKLGPNDLKKSLEKVLIERHEHFGIRYYSPFELIL
jgi:hypothetical protein